MNSDTSLSASAAAPRSGFASFAEFYPFYLGEHSNRTCRRLHVVGTVCLIALPLYVLLTQHWAALLLEPVAAYGFAWTGHFVFERNRPATFEHPLWSALGDFRMTWEIFSGRIAW